MDDSLRELHDMRDELNGKGKAERDLLFDYRIEGVVVSMRVSVLDGCGTITSALEREPVPERLDTGETVLQLIARQQDAEVYNAAIDVLESVVLAHAVAGVDVESKAYIEGLDTALEALNNNLL